MDERQFAELLKKNGLPADEQRLACFRRYYGLLIEWNKKMNLTAITDKEEVYLKHFYDSITPAFYYSFDRAGTSLCDVGAGAGFPGIPLKILFPSLKLTIVDSLKKRMVFLETLVRHLQLENVYLYHDRAETFAHKKEHREAYDVVTARAVARLAVLCEYCLPLVKQQGTFIAMKGKDGEEELQEAGRAITVLGGSVDRTDHFQLPEGEGARILIGIRKIRHTPGKYPRNPGIPAKQPIL
mgnify:CR=1 FL=1|jgi:16S rRNA m(7)G-527 methyltransferase (EC 2.1.1.-)